MGLDSEKIFLVAHHSALNVAWEEHIRDLEKLMRKSLYALWFWPCSRVAVTVSTLRECTASDVFTQTENSIKKHILMFRAIAKMLFNVLTAAEFNLLCDNKLPGLKNLRQVLLSCVSPVIHN